ncbi:hypothetical protein D3C81_717260 [compost metagenome]
MAPAADPVLVGFGQQVIHGIDPLGVDLAQRRFGKVIAGVEERQCARAWRMLGRPVEMLLQVSLQGRAAAGKAWVEQEVLHVDRDEFLGAAQLIAVGAACHLAVVLFALATTADILRPASQVEQARVVTEGETAFGLATALFGQADFALAVLLSGALGDQPTLRTLPQAGAVIDVGQLMQDGGQQLLAYGAVGAAGLLRGGAAIGKARQQAAIELQGGDQRCLAVGVGRHAAAPADQDASVKAGLEARRQCLQGFVQQCLAGPLLLRVQVVGLQHQLQVGQCRAAEQYQQATQQPGTHRLHRARMASARTWSLAWRASGTRWRRVSKAASSCAPRISPRLAT